MTKINAQLQTEINAHPTDEFDVIITLKEGSNPDAVKLVDYKNLMENMLVARLNAKNIKKLAKNKAVISIELDSEMGIM